MIGNLTECGHCNKEVGKDGNEFFVVILAFNEADECVLKMLAICQKCFNKIPESLRTSSQNKMANGADVVNICRPEKERDETTMRPVYSVHKNTIKFCVGELGQKFWPRSY